MPSIASATATGAARSAARAFARLEYVVEVGRRHRIALKRHDRIREFLALVRLDPGFALGEFGPILVFAGATRMKTEVLSTSVFLELSIGNLDAAVAVSLLMVLMAVTVLLILRAIGMRLTA